MGSAMNRLTDWKNEAFKRFYLSQLDAAVARNESPEYAHLIIGALNAPRDRAELHDLFPSIGISALEDITHNFENEGFLVLTGADTWPTLQLKDTYKSDGVRAENFLIRDADRFDKEFESCQEYGLISIQYTREEKFLHTHTSWIAKLSENGTRLSLRLDRDLTDISESQAIDASSAYFDLRAAAKLYSRTRTV